MISLFFQCAYVLCLLPVCFYICCQIQVYSKKALELLANTKGFSKEKAVWIPMIVLMIFQPVIFMFFGHLGLYFFKVIFR